MEQKEKYVKRISYLNGYTQSLIGLGSGILPDSKLLVSYSDTTNKQMIIEESSVNITDNPLTGKIDVVIKLSLKKEEYVNEAD